MNKKIKINKKEIYNNEKNNRSATFCFMNNAICIVIAFVVAAGFVFP